MYKVALIAKKRLFWTLMIILAWTNLIHVRTNTVYFDNFIVVANKEDLMSSIRLVKS